MDTFIEAHDIEPWQMDLATEIYGFFSHMV
jgi:hypothetical protein